MSDAAQGKAGVDLQLERHLREESNRALERASLVTLLLGVVASLGLPALMLGGIARDLWVPWYFSLWGAASSGLLYGLARRQWVVGRLAYLVCGIYASLPTFLFVVSELSHPVGVAIYMLGPMSYLYAVLIVITAGLFRFRIALFTGAVVAVSYAVLAYLALPRMRQIDTGDPLFDQELHSYAIWLIKALMLFFVGLTAGSLAVVGRRLIRRAIEHERERARIRGLFGQYVAEEVVERLLTATERQAGERREVVVLFADLRGFTAYSEQVAPEEVVARLNRYFDSMVEAITARGGVVDKFVGDAIMAVFDGVVPLADPADCAVEAAREMHRRLQALNAQWQREGQLPWRAGIGIHRGEVVLGSVGSSTRKDFTIIGDAVNTAARLEGLTKERGAAILISEAVHGALKGAHAPQALGEVAVRGKQRVLPIYAVPVDAAS